MTSFTTSHDRDRVVGVPADHGVDVALQRGAHRRAGQALDPLRRLAVPQQRVAVDDLVVGGGVGDDAVGLGEVVGVGLRVDGVPLHRVLGGHLVELRRGEAAVRGVLPRGAGRRVVAEQRGVGGVADELVPGHGPQRTGGLGRARQRRPDRRRQGPRRRPVWRHYGGGIGETFFEYKTSGSPGRWKQSISTNDRPTRRIRYHSARPPFPSVMMIFTSGARLLHS